MAVEAVTATKFAPEEARTPEEIDAEWKGNEHRYFWHTRGHQLLVPQYLHGNVLDIGCGAGYMAAWTFPNEAHYTGVDRSAEALRQAKGLFPAAHFHQVDIEKEELPFSDQSFDTVVLSEVLEHLPNHAWVLPEAMRVSRLYMVVTVPINMPGVGHVHPEWSYRRMIELGAQLGTLIEFRRLFEMNTQLIWVRTRGVVIKEVRTV